MMDTTDPTITFNDSGQCHHCRGVEARRGVSWFPGPEGAVHLDRMLAAIKAEGKRKDYDCILGLSGGVDSSYLALKARDWDLRPLVVHVDAGWNSELAVQNIERIVKHTGYELHTHVIGWEAMRRLQVSYLRAGVANQDAPQDHAFFASLYGFATRHDVKYVLNGGNVATEGIFPSAWQWAAMDARNLKSIHRTMSQQRLTDFPTMSIWRYYVWFPYVKGMKPVRPLNFLPYAKSMAIEELSSTGWRPYPRKHGESLFTKWFQDYYLPTRFGFDMRRPHLASLVASGEMDRAAALDLLEQPLYDPSELQRDTEYVSRKLRISSRELDDAMQTPLRHASEFPNWNSTYLLLKRIQQTAQRVLGRELSTYS